MNGAEQRWDAVRALLRGRADEPALVARPRTEDPPASFGQEALWFMSQLEPDSTAYHLAVACRLEGVLDVAALERSLSELVVRHEVLRTTLHATADGIAQRVEPPRPITLSIENVSADALDRWASTSTELPFDRHPPFRVRLAKSADDDHTLLLVVHHCIFDGWSFELFMHELCALYGGSRLSDPRFQFGDVATWQRQCLTEPRRDQLLAYWKRQLDGELPLLRLPVDHQSTARRGASQTLALPKDLVESLKALGTANGATLYATLLAAFQVLLHRITGDDDIIVGSPFTTRNRAELRDVIGMFVNTLPLRTHLGGQPSFRELLVRTRATVAGALEHQDLPFELIARAVHAPLFRVMFALQNIPRTGWQWPGLRATAWNIPPRSAKCDLCLTVNETEHGATALMEYDAGKLDEATITRMLTQLRTLLEAIVRDPEQAIDRLPILSPAERQRLLTAWNDTTAPYPRDQPIHRIFEEHARRTPAATALVCEHGRVSYGELDRQANALAHRLLHMQLGPAPLVAIVLERSPAMIVAQLAILKIGGAYVPVDPERIAGAAAVITDRALAVAIPVLRIDEPTEEDNRAVDIDVPADALAYVMFTSGSTGTPRGVCVPHRGVVRLVVGTTYARFTPDDVFLQLAPATFDASTFEIWGALLNGATLVLAPARPLSIAEIRHELDHHAVTTLLLTSGIFERFVDEGMGGRALRQLFSGGDVMSPTHAARFVRERPACTLINVYGPTENTTYTTTHVVHQVEAGASIPIGRPVTNTRVYVLDAHLEPVPLGTIGELYTSGDGLARGYLADDEATRERFLPSPFGDGDVLYKTGDLVRQRADGVLEFTGRADDQIKIRDARVEPRGIERVLAEHARVRRVAIVVDTIPTRRLVAFVIPDRADDELPATLRAFVRSRLPAYMVPAEIVLVDDIPLNANGKVDRGALQRRPRPVRSIADFPRDTVEQRLAELFARLIRRERVGIRDSFFDIGGDSLAAVELAAAIERELGHALPLVTIFQRPTIEQLAEAIRTRTPPRVELGPRVVELKPGAMRQPLFLVASGPGGREDAAICARLVATLRDHQAVFGLLAPLQGGSVVEIARQHVDEITRLQPHGPYRIGGQCIGGAVAYEIAQQLRARGEQIDLLLLIDSWCPTTTGVIYERLIGRPRSRIRAGLAFLASVPTRRRSEPWLHELWRRAFVPAAAKAHMRACLAYRPAAYPGAITLIASEESLRLGITERWQALAQGGLVVHRAPGDHESYFKTYSRETAEVLRTCLEQQRKVGHELSH